MRYDAITTPDIKHDIYNILTELVILNNDLYVAAFPWRDPKYTKLWGKTIAVIRKLVRDHKLSKDQIAFYILKCHPKSIDGAEFGKMAVVARRLLQKQDLGGVVDIYRRRRASGAGELERIGYKRLDTVVKTKSLEEFLRELESGEKKEIGGRN